VIVHELTIEGRPWTMNGERAAHWRDHRDRTATWRYKTGLLANVRKFPRCTRIDVEAEFLLHHPLPDTGNSYPAVKAIIDGLVDAKIIPDDSATHVRSIKMHAPTNVPRTQPERVVVCWWEVEP